MTFDLRKAADRALRHIEISAATGCTPESFARALATGEIAASSRSALTLLFDEGDENMLVDLVTEGASTFEALATLSSILLPPDHPTVRFLSEPPL